MATFHPFPNLPMELQDRIWHFALEQAHGERRVGMRLDQIGSRTTIAWSSLSIFLKDSDSVNRRKPSSIRRGVVSDIIISCRGARHYFTHLRTKQLRLFPGLAPAGTEGVELYNFLSAVNLDFDCFQIHWPMCRPYLSWYDEIGSHDSRQWPPILYHLRQVDIIFFEDHLIDLLVHTTRKRASQTTRLGRCDMFHTVALGPFAHPKAKIESLAVTIKVQLVLSVDKILERLDRVITTFSSYAAMDSSLVANEYRWSSWLSSVWRLAALNSLGLIKLRPVIWAAEEKLEWMEEIRSFLGHVSQTRY
jgi:hypothetical protein